MRFFVGLAAAIWTLGQVGPLGWFLLFMLVVFGAALFLWAWPLLLALAIILGAWRAARWAEARRHRRFVERIQRYGQ